MHSADSRWKFSVAVLLPGVAAVLVTVALAAGFVLWSAQRTDQAALSRQQAVVAHFVQGARADFENTQRTVVLRYETTEAFLYDEPDLEWIEPEMGWAEYVDFSHDRVYVLDPDLQPIYVAREGETAELATYDTDRAVIDPIAVRFRTPEMVAAIQTYETGDADLPPQLSDFVTIGGRIAFASVLPITSNWDDQGQEPGGHYYHVAIQFLDNGVADDMAEDYLLPGAHFDVVPNTLSSEKFAPAADSRPS